MADADLTAGAVLPCSPSQRTEASYSTRLLRWPLGRVASALSYSVGKGITLNAVPHAFLSHASEDGVLAVHLAKDLLASGIDTLLMSGTSQPVIVSASGLTLDSGHVPTSLFFLHPSVSLNLG